MEDMKGKFQMDFYGKIGDTLRFAIDFIFKDCLPVHACGGASHGRPPGVLTDCVWAPSLPPLGAASLLVSSPPSILFSQTLLSFYISIVPSQDVVSPSAHPSSFNPNTFPPLPATRASSLLGFTSDLRPTVTAEKGVSPLNCPLNDSDAFSHLSTASTPRVMADNPKDTHPTMASLSPMAEPSRCQDVSLNACLPFGPHFNVVTIALAADFPSRQDDSLVVDVLSLPYSNSPRLKSGEVPINPQSSWVAIVQNKGVNPSVELKFFPPQSIEGSATFVDVKVDYQWRPSRCERCQKIGHSIAQCKPKMMYRPTGWVLSCPSRINRTLRGRSQLVLSRARRKMILRFSLLIHLRPSKLMMDLPL
ncbi:hypothetical protein Nepgr_001022 [Nepenthes gracilis]|uniref:DUF4283 domain-containing protein n=1 Tax=Nepenthes gracilis TaxID=150966 RepID=A0AAD3P6B3_NEPGR|nr:hypothetical protein Nepgr_001022 [Nepenthes gracilis]